MTKNEISTLLDQKAEALKNVFDATENLYAAKADLEQVTTQFTLEGLEGNNDRVRQADLVSKTEAERDSVALAERNLRATRLDFELANLKVDELTYKLRLLEMQR